MLVSLRLDENVKDLAFGVDCAPEIDHPAADFQICPPGSSTIPSPRDPFGSDHARAISPRPSTARSIDVAILRDLYEARGKNPYVFAGRPQRPLSAMAMSMLLRRMKIDATVHGMRSSFRMWAADVAHAPFEVAEQCLAHVTGNAVVQAYQRSSMLERRRPIMSAWASFVSGEDVDNVVPLRQARS